MQELIHKNQPTSFLRLTEEDSLEVKLPIFIESPKKVRVPKLTGLTFLRLTPEVDLNMDSGFSSRRSSVEM
ncbi:hypothetical protein K7432_015915 [Basidiobolus ranarum]|uniref:Uncharacterized protein n=1 Tax=Basidiobolus ranarum TaxID=34480 RepID=A0ABR2VMD8_9FUNG